MSTPPPIPPIRCDRTRRGCRRRHLARFRAPRWPWNARGMVRAPPPTLPKARPRATCAHHPGDGIIGEEDDDVDGSIKAGRRPIDGTKAFTKGVPLYATRCAHRRPRTGRGGSTSPPSAEPLPQAGDSAHLQRRPAACRDTTLDGVRNHQRFWIPAFRDTAAGARQRRRLNVGRRLRLRPGRHRPRRGDDRSLRQPMGHRPDGCDHPRSGWTLLQLRRRRTPDSVEPQQRRRHERPSTTTSSDSSPIEWVPRSVVHEELRHRQTHDRGPPVQHRSRAHTGLRRRLGHSTERRSKNSVTAGSSIDITASCCQAHTTGASDPGTAQRGDGRRGRRLAIESRVASSTQGHRRSRSPRARVSERSLVADRFW